VPFVRTVKQAARVNEMLAERGLKRGEHGLRLIMMCEVPSNAILADQFLEHFDGMSIGSNDLTQLTLGLDRDSGIAQLAQDFDERDPAVKALISRAIMACRATGKYVGICGQGPSDHPDFADHLFYLHWANATFMTNGMMALVAQCSWAAVISPRSQSAPRRWRSGTRRSARWWRPLLSWLRSCGTCPHSWWSRALCWTALTTTSARRP
jgi:hypothetical protein